jgi:hypothetical protein
MPQFVIEFGAEQLESVASAIKATVAEPLRISIDSEESEMSYSATARTLDEVATDLATGSVPSAIIRTTDPRIRYALITSPRIHVPPLALWMGTIEVTVEEWQFVWDALLDKPGLRFVCVAREEGIEVSNQQISPETFPWDVDGLLAAAVRTDEHSEWTRRVAIHFDLNSR